jgi:hypothetical protein
LTKKQKQNVHYYYTFLNLISQEILRKKQHRDQMSEVRGQIIAFLLPTSSEGEQLCGGDGRAMRAPTKYVQ